MNLLLRALTLVFTLGCGLCSASLHSQLNYDYTEGKFLIKGYVQDIQTKKRLPSVNIRITNSGKGITTDNEGNFALYLAPDDTLKFSIVGYISKVIHVRNIDSFYYYTLEVGLIRDFVKIKEVTIYPFSNLDEFKKAFVDAKDKNKVIIPGVDAPKYSNTIPKAKLTNPVSFIYERLKKKRAADPDFRP